MITIDIENPSEIAGRQSFLARAFGGLAPGFVQRKVEEKIVEKLEEVFADEGIRATIRIQPPDTPPRSNETSWEV